MLKAYRGACDGSIYYYNPRGTSRPTPALG